MRDNNVKIIVSLVLVIFICLVFSGCLTGTEVDNNKLNVDFKSDIVNLLEYDLELVKNKENRIIRAIVTGTISNKLSRIIEVDIKSEFYDKNDNYIGEKTFTIIGLRSKNKPGDTTSFTITYEGENVYMVDYAKLYASEKT